MMELNPRWPGPSRRARKATIGKPLMHSLNITQIVTIPLISAFVGWVTNMVAVRMLFRPRRSFKVFGIEFQGLVPRRQGELATSIAHTVEQHLIGPDDVRQALMRPEALAGVRDAIRQPVAEFIDVRLRQVHPMVGMFLTGAIKQKLEELMLSEIETMLPLLGERMLDNVTAQLDFQRIVEDRVRAFDLDKLENMILEVSHRELRAIELLGGVLGFMIGLIQLAILAI
jgi:uncharacterized membrane protein YheB (UPF0754 family)